MVAFRFRGKPGFKLGDLSLKRQDPRVVGLALGFEDFVQLGDLLAVLFSEFIYFFVQFL